MIKAVIFDLDDTLISEREFVIGGFMSVTEILSVQVGNDVQTVFGMLMDLFQSSPKNVFDRLLTELQIPYTKELIADLVEAYRNHEPEIRFYDDVLPCLERLKAQGIKTGIISDGQVSTQRNKLKALDADEYFDNIIITDELGREYRKPNPTAFDTMRDVLGVEFEEMVYVGDNPEKDFHIGSVYPIKTVRICREEGLYAERDYAENVEEHIRIHSLEEIHEAIEGDLPAGGH